LRCKSAVRQGCHRRQPKSAGATGRFTVFRERELVLHSLELPVQPAVTVGSSIGPDLVSSSAPDVVSVDSAGSLVGHRNGSVVVRSKNGSALLVRVQAGDKLRVEPAELTLAPGERSRVTVMLGNETVAPEGVSWQMTDPR
jgi:hypothetical protein